jgi:hypothetical protein
MKVSAIRRSRFPRQPLGSLSPFEPGRYDGWKGRAESRYSTGPCHRKVCAPRRGFGVSSSSRSRHPPELPERLFQSSTRPAKSLSRNSATAVAMTGAAASIGRSKSLKCPCVIVPIVTLASSPSSLTMTEPTAGCAAGNTATSSGVSPGRNDSSPKRRVSSVNRAFRMCTIDCTGGGGQCAWALSQRRVNAENLPVNPRTLQTTTLTGRGALSTCVSQTAADRGAFECAGANGQSAHANPMSACGNLVSAHVNLVVPRGKLVSAHVNLVVRTCEPRGAHMRKHFQQES